MNNNTPLRGEIWVAQLDPAIGSEIKKTRPVLIVSNNQHNRLTGHVTVLPITDPGNKTYITEVFLPKGTASLLKDSKIRCSQIRVLDKTRLVKSLGTIPQSFWSSIEKALRIHLGF